MKATELIGRTAIRTRPAIRTDGSRDYSYTKQPVKIEEVSNKYGVGYCWVDKQGNAYGEIHRSTLLNDDNWGPVPYAERSFKNGIVIRTVKQLNEAGDMGYRVTGIEALDRHTLPPEYLQARPQCYMDGPDKLCIWADTGVGSAVINKGEWYRKERFHTLLDEVRECGQRLHEIRQKAKAERETWKGEEVFRI